MMKFQYILMMPFLTGTGLERVGVVGPDLDRWQAGLQAPGSSGLKWDCCSAGRGSPLQKARKKGGRRGLRPWPL